MRNFVIGCIVLFTMAGTAFSETKEPPKELTVDLGKGVKLEMVLIPAGEFLMGSPDSDKDAQSWEKPQHRVRITKPFYLGKYLVTQEQWEAVMGNNPSQFKGPKNPVEQVSWDDCQKFLGKLNAKSAARAGKFVLPTEAQWEYACRAGSKTRYCFGDDELELGRLCVVSRELGRHDTSCGREEAECLGAIRHARERIGVVSGLVEGRVLQGVASGRSDGTSERLAPRVSRRLLGPHGGGLPVGAPLLLPAWVQARPTGLACLPSLTDSRAHPPNRTRSRPRRDEFRGGAKPQCPAGLVGQTARRPRRALFVTSFPGKGRFPTRVGHPILRVETAQSPSKKSESLCFS